MHFRVVLYYGGRAFDHFTRSDLRDQMIGERLNWPYGREIFGICVHAGIIPVKS